MADILSRIRKTLGEDALILSTRKRKRNGLGAFTEEVYEVSAAVDRAAAAPAAAAARRFIPPAYRAPVGPGPGPHPPVPPAPAERRSPAERPSPAAQAPAPFEAFLSFEKEIVPLKEEIRSLKGFLEQIAMERKGDGGGDRKERLDELAREVRSLRDLLTNGIPPARAARPEAQAAPEPCGNREEAAGPDWLTRRLAAQGVRPSLGEAIRRAALVRRPGNDRATDEDLRREAGVVIEASIRAAKLPSPADTGPRILAFVGPPGSGKTETVSRAARMLAGRGSRLAVVTVDGEGNGADPLYESLQRPLGIPVLHASDGETLSRAVATCFGAEYLLIDVAGSALSGREALRRLFGMFRTHAKIDFCLTLPADWEGPPADRIAEELSPLRVRYLAFTKMDEAKRYGGILNAAAGSKLPVLFLSARELFPARPYMFSRLLLGDRQPDRERRTT